MTLITKPVAAAPTTPVLISAIIPVSGRFDPPGRVYEAYRQMLKGTGEEFEFIYVLDGPQPRFVKKFNVMKAGLPQATIVQLKRPFGEVACLYEGARLAAGKTLLFLPAYLQVEPPAIATLLDRLKTADVVVASRDRSRDNLANRFRGWLFKISGRVVGYRFEDPGCAVRAVKRHVLDELVLQKDQHPFFPLLAERLGFAVEQLRLPQAKADRRFRGHNARTYLNRLLDILALGFLLSFIEKPFRFFGTIGAAFVTLGLAMGIYLLAQREFMNVPLADRPALLLLALMVVLGVQIGAVGLIAEIVIFTRHRSNPTYRIEKIVEHGQPIPYDKS